MSNETYFLSSLESEALATTRECVVLKRLRFHTGKDCFLATIQPPLVGLHLGPSQELGEVLIASRHEGQSLSPVGPFPCFVFVCRPLTEHLVHADSVSKDDVEILGWGELYRTRADADGHVFESE